LLRSKLRRRIGEIVTRGSTIRDSGFGRSHGANPRGASTPLQDGGSPEPRAAPQGHEA